MTSSPSDVQAREGVRRTRRYVTATVVVGVVVFLAVEAGMARPELRGVLRTIEGLWRVDVGWVVVAVLASPISMSMFALTRRRLLLAAGTRVSARSTVAAAYVANSLHATLPGGVAFSTGYTYRWMRGHGVSGLVALDEGPTLTAMLTDVDPEALAIGMAVEMVVRRIGAEGEEGPLLYGDKFRPQESV